MPKELTAELQAEKKAIIDEIWRIDGLQGVLYANFANEEIGRKKYKADMKALNEEKAAADKALRVFKRQNPEPLDQGGIPKVDRFLDAAMEDPEVLKAVQDLVEKMKG